MKKGYIRTESRTKKKFDKKRKNRKMKAKVYTLEKQAGKRKWRETQRKLKKIMEKTRPVFKHKRFLFKWLNPWKFAFEYNQETKLWILGLYFFVIGINLKNKYDV